MRYYLKWLLSYVLFCTIIVWGVLLVAHTVGLTQ